MNEMDASCFRQIDSVIGTYRKVRDEVSAAVSVASKPRAPQHTTAVFYHSACLQHTVPPWHPESPQRLEVSIQAIQRVIAQAAEAQNGTKGQPEPLMLCTSPRPISMEIVRLVHTPEYLKTLESTPWNPQNEPVSLQLPSGDTDTFLSRPGLQAAYIAS